MKVNILLLFFCFFPSVGLAFILIDPEYRLANPDEVIIEIANGGCQANGISNSELTSVLHEAVDSFWNTVSESRLYIKVGDESSRTISEQASSGRILIGCQAFGAGGPNGIANMNATKDGCRIRLNGTTFVPGGFIYEGLLGTIVHELGHCVGLDHSDDPASVMTYRPSTWKPGPKALSRDDKNGVIYLYPYEKKALGLLGGCGLLEASQGPVQKSRFEILANGLLFLFLFFLAPISIKYLIARRFR